VTGVGDIEASPKEDAYSLCAHVPFIAFTKTAHVHVIKCFRALLPLLLKTRTSQCHALASHRWPAQTAVPCIAKARKYTAQWHAGQEPVRTIPSQPPHPAFSAACIRELQPPQTSTEHRTQP